MIEPFQPEIAETASSEDIEAALLITLAILARATNRTPSKIRNLINGGQFDQETQRFSGVSSLEIRKLLDQLRRSLSRRSLRATEQLLSGDITLAQWQLIITEETKNYSIVAAALAIGGLAIIRSLSRQQSRLFWLGIDRALRRQIDGLSRVTARIGNGIYTPDRVRWYGDYKSSSVVGSYNQARKLGLMVTGFNEGRRWMDPAANHCVDCPAYETDWTDITNIVPVGVACRCNGRCRCTTQYRFNPERILNETLEEKINRAAAFDSTLFRRLG